jgi:hypothetical protein
MNGSAWHGPHEACEGLVSAACDPMNGTRLTPSLESGQALATQVKSPFMNSRYAGCDEWYACIWKVTRGEQDTWKPARR